MVFHKNVHEGLESQHFFTARFRGTGFSRRDVEEIDDAELGLGSVAKKHGSKVRTHAQVVASEQLSRQVFRRTPAPQRKGSLNLLLEKESHFVPLLLLVLEAVVVSFVVLS